MMPPCWSAALPPEDRLAPIVEVKRRLDGSQARFDCLVCALKPGRRAAVLYRLDRDWHFPQLDLTIPAGALSTGFFWTRHPFNLYHWMTPSGETLGDYFNLAGETTIAADEITWLDLAVDYCLVPGKAGVFLDEDELPGGVGASIQLQVGLGRTQLKKNAGRIARWMAEISKGYLRDISGLDTMQFSPS